MSCSLKSLLCCGALLISGCAVARRPYQTPTTIVPPQWSRDLGSSQQPSDEALSQWWMLFDDPTLSDLVDRFVRGSPDMRTALSRVREARAQVGVARATRMPSISAGPSASLNHLSTEAGGGFDPGGYSQHSFSLESGVSWEADVFGELRAGIASASTTADASVLDLQDVLVAGLADAGTQYIRARALQERVRLAERNASLQGDTLAIAEFRFQAGLTTELDIHQARANLESTRAQAAALQSDLELTIHTLAVLVGAAPDSLNSLVGSAADIPVPRDEVALGVPAEALRRRPDVRAAERRVAAAWAQGDAARARLYPRFSLVGSIGLESLDLARLLVPGAGFFRLTPSSTWRFFDRRQLRQSLVVQDERISQAAVQYESTVLRALREVEDALTTYVQERIRRDSLTDAVAAAQRAADLAVQRYNTGLRDFRDVLDSQRSLVSLQDQLASSRANVSAAAIRLYRALGGGWSALTRFAP